MGEHAQVNGDQALEQVMAELRRAGREGGRALFVIGPPGAGKSALLSAARRSARWRQLRLRTALVDCRALPAGASAWQRLGRAGTAHLRLGQVAGSTAGDWANLLPVVGDVVSALIGTVRTVRRSPAAPPGSRDPSGAALAGARSLLSQGATHARLLLLDSLEEASAADLAASAFFVRQLQGTRTLLLAAARGRDGRAAGAVEDLVLESERLGPGRRLALGGVEGGAQLGWPGPVAAAGSPPALAAAFARRAPAPADQALLARAAALGATFSAAALAEAAGLPELEVEDRLALLARSGLLRFLGTAGEAEAGTSVYAWVDAPAAPPPG